jgi:uncharacterized protein YndB with AHSA1/START domain
MTKDTSSDHNKSATQQADANDALGTIIRTPQGFSARLERIIDHEQQLVWQMLTDPAKLVEWLAPGEIECRRGGSAKLNFVDSGIIIDSTVTEFDPPRLLEYSWSSPGEPERPVRYELEPLPEERTRLILTLTSPADEDVARSCAGWEAHLMMLLAAIEGVPIKFPFERFQSTRQAYNQLLAQAR